MTIAFEASPTAVSPVQKRAAAAVVSGELRAGMLFTGALVVIAICAVLASPQPPADAMWMALIGP